ncbi:MAG: L-lactate dehydrogenase [Eubacterium sp.]
MAISRSKVVIIGAGNVGTALAHHLVICNICDDLVLIDLNKGKVWAEVTDLKHSMGYSDNKMLIADGTYADCSDADIVVLAVAAPYRTGMTRLDMLDKATEIVSSIVPEVMKSGFHGMFVVITNPVDSMTYLVQKLSGLDESRVIGTGTALDSARLRYYLADVMGVDARSVEAMCMGEHGDSQMIPWSQVTVGAKKFTEIMHDYPERVQELDLSKVQSDIAQVAYKIVNQKGATNYGISAVAARIIKAIISDENIVMPVSVMPHGEYGLHDLYIGIPAVLTGKGVKELVEYHLTDEEQRELQASANVLMDANRRMLK